MKLLLFVNFLCLAVLAAEDQNVLEQMFRDGNQKLTANLFTEVAKVNPGKSFVLSAFSVMTPLAQLSIAAREKTREQLWEAIGISKDENVIGAFSLTNTKIRSLQGVTLKTASKLYLAKNYDVYKDFGAATWELFSTSPQNIDFEESFAAANEINNWVEQQTNNRIKNLVKPDSLGWETRGVLVNAIYFKGLWAEPFDARLTRERDFRVNDRDTIKVPLMYRRGDYRYKDSSSLKSQIIEIPYLGGETSLIVVLPHEVDGIKELQEQLKDPFVLGNELSQMKEKELDLYLPKFKIETTIDLKDALEKINVTEIFSQQNARLDYLIRTRGNMYIDSATQKAFIEVNEDGVEAAAGNRITFTDNSLLAAINKKMGIQVTSLVPQFYANKPFYFVLKMNSLPLFNGIMYGK